MWRLLLFQASDARRIVPTTRHVWDAPEKKRPLTQTQTRPCWGDFRGRLGLGLAKPFCGGTCVPSIQGISAQPDFVPRSADSSRPLIDGFGCTPQAFLQAPGSPIAFHEDLSENQLTKTFVNGRLTFTKTFVKRVSSY